MVIKRGLICDKFYRVISVRTNGKDIRFTKNVHVEATDVV